jgi:predicted PurR-regulated permease PerM
MKAKYFLGIILILNIYWLSILYSPFLENILIALMFSVATVNIHNKLDYYFNSEFFASFSSSILLAFLFFAPIGYFIYSGIILLKHIDPKQFELIMPAIKDFIEFLIPDCLNYLKNDIKEFLVSSDIPAMVTNMAKYAISLGGESAIFVKDSVMIIIFYFFIQFYRNKLGRYFKRIIPLSTQDTISLFREVSAVISVVFYSVIATATLEGGLFAIIAYIYGYNPILFGVLYGFSSLIPFVGGFLMWLPLVIYEISMQHYQNAIIIGTYTIIVISIIADTFLKPIIISYINKKILKSDAYVNELLIFFSMIAGLGAFGFWGVIIGPAITTLFLSLVKLYESLYHKNIEVVKSLKR